MTSKLPPMVEIEFLGIALKGGKRIEHFTELGQKHGIGEKLRVPKYRAASLIKTYPDGFRYTSDADASRESHGGESGDGGESGSESEDSGPESKSESMVQKAKNLFNGKKKKKAKKPRRDKSMKGRHDKSQ